MYNGQNEYVPHKKRTKSLLNGHRLHMGYSSRKLCYLSWSWQFTTQVERTSTDTYKIPTGCHRHEKWTDRTRAGQTAYQRMSNIHIYLVASVGSFEHIQNLPTDRTGENGFHLTWNAFTALGTNKKRLQTDTNDQRILLSVSAIPYGVTVTQRIKVTDAERTEKLQKMFIQLWKLSQWRWMSMPKS